MSQVVKLRGWVLGLVVLVLAGAGLPAIGQGPTEWEVAFETDAHVQTDSPRLFDSGANFAAGFYRIDYVSGACDYHGSNGVDNYNLNFKFWYNGSSVGGHVVQAFGPSVAPANGFGWDSPGETKDAAFASGKTSVEFQHGGGTIGVVNADASDQYTNNVVPGDIKFRLTRLINVDKYELKILVGESVSNTKASEEGNEGKGEKAGGHQIPADSTTMITCKVPGGLSNADVKFDFSALPEESIKMYDENDNEVTKSDTWAISEGTKVFKLVTNDSFSAKDIRLYAADSATGDQTNQADDATTTDVAVCPDYVTLNGGGCGSCGAGSSCTGESSGNAGCLDFQINLGGLGFDEEGGYLQLFARRPSDGLYKPDSLQFFLNDRLVAADGFTDDGDKITPSETSDADWGEAVLTLHVDGYGYDVDFYESNGGVLATSPYRTVTVENLNGATSDDELYITETIDLDASTAPKVRMWHFEWTGTSAGETDDGSWVLTEGEAAGAAGLAGDTILRITERDEVWNGAGDEVTETVTIKESDNTVVSKTEEVWKVFDWGRERTSMTMDPDSGDALKEEWTYYDDLSGDGEDNYGRLESYQSKTGYSERYEYDADGNVAKTMRQYEDEALALGTAFATEAADNIVEEYTENGSVSITGYTNDVRVEKRQIKVQGTIERTWYKVYVDEADSLISDCTEEWSVRPVVEDPENGTTLAAVIEDVLDGTDTTSITTKSWHWVEGAPGIGDNEPYDVRAMQSSDGQYTVYERTIATDERTTVVKRGFSDDTLTDILAGTGGADIEYGTKTTSVTDARGNMVLTKNEKISESDNGGNWFITALMKVGVDGVDPETDEFGRPLVTEYFFGEEAADEAATPGSGTAAYDTRMTFGCCGGGEQEVRTGRDGVQTTTLEDVLGRTAFSKRWANTGAAVYSVNEYDAAGRVIASGLSTDDDLDDAADLKSSRTYDVAGRMTSATDEEGRKSYITYRRVTTTGAVYGGSGVFYWETRGYGHDANVPVSVSWTDSHGRTVLSFMGNCASFTGAGGVPSGTESLTERTRSVSFYDWDDRMTEGRAYFFINSLAKDAPGTQGTNYIVTGKNEYDALGRGFRSTDATGNITQTVYEDGTGRAIKTLVGVDVNDLHTVSRVYYNKFSGSNPTGDDRPWPTRVYTVKPGLATAPDDSDLDDSAPTFTDYTYTESVEEFNVVDATNDYMTRRFLWSRPEFGPWSRQTSEEEGRPLNSRTYRNGSTTYELSRTVNEYWDTSDASDGKLYLTKQYRMSAGTASSNWLETRYFYDDAGRSVKVNSKGRGYSKTQYDAYGRNERTVFASSEGASNDVTTFADDIILTESVPTYDKSGRVTGTVTYERAHDATATGLLSAAAANQSRANYSYTWFDANGRTTHSATVGTDASYTYVAGTPPTPNTSDDVIVTKIDYGAAGFVYLRTDNLGRQTRIFNDSLQRVVHSIENWDGVLTTPDTPGSRAADVNRITKNIFDNSATGGGARIETVAIDPDSDGNTSDNQSTHYIHSGEVNAAERGPIPVNGRPLAVLMPDAIEDGTTRANVITEINAGGEVFGDFSFTEYYANGQAKRSTDQRGVQRNAFYTAEGWTDYTTVTEATGNTWDSIGDLRSAYTYGDAGEVLTITTYDDVSGGTSNETSQLTYTYDGFYNRLTEKQDHDPTANSGAGDPKTITYAYDTTLSGSYYSKAYRLKTTTYPNGRVIHATYDGHNGIDDAIGRANALAEDSSGSPGADIASYSYLGSGRMVIKDLPTPDIKLDYFAPGSGVAGTSGTYAGLDAFGRIKAQQWIDHAGTEFDVLHIKHGYDRNSNKKYADRQVYKSYSAVYGHDELDRLTTFDQGLIKSDQSAIEDHWITRRQHVGLDQMGNPVTVKEYTNDTADDPFTEITSLSSANEIESIKIQGDRGKPPLINDSFDTDTSANYDVSNDDGDAFSINTTNGDLTVTNLGTDGETILLVGEEIAVHTSYTYLVFPDETGGEAGYVFGYTGPDDYYLAITDTQYNRHRFYRVANGTRTLLKSTNLSGFGTGDYIEFSAMIGNYISQRLSGTWLADGVPAGRVGLYTNQADVKFTRIEVWSDGRRPTLAGRWRPSGQQPTGGDSHRINKSDDALSLANWVSNFNSTTAILEGVRADRFEVTFSASGGQWDAPYVAFNNRYGNRFQAFRTFLHNSGDEFWSVYGNKSVVGSSSGPGSNAWTNSKKWIRITNDGTTVSAQVSNSSSEPDWSGVSVIRSTTALDAFGGMIGFGCNNGTIKIDNVTIKTDRNDDLLADGYETTEYEGDFTLDGDGYAEEALTYDAAGNVTYDGRYAYAYDAFNRLVEVQIAYYAPGESTLSFGSVINEMRYDGNNRRIVKYVKNSADLDCTYHSYYTGHSIIEERDGSDNVIRQNVWGLMYIDELVMTSLNNDPDDLGEQDVEDHFYTLHDTQYNILALVDSTGKVKEHYEYTPHGERQVFISISSNDDPYALTPFFISDRKWVGGTQQPYGRNPFGFQGLHHDEETFLVHNRGRMHNPRLKRFNQRDPHPSIYPDGLNAYADYRSMLGGVDPRGTDVIIPTSPSQDYYNDPRINPLNPPIDQATGKPMSPQDYDPDLIDTDWSDPTNPRTILKAHTWVQRTKWWKVVNGKCTCRYGIVLRYRVHRATKKASSISFRFLEKSTDDDIVADYEGIDETKTNFLNFGGQVITPGNWEEWDGNNTDEFNIIRGYEDDGVLPEIAFKPGPEGFEPATEEWGEARVIQWNGEVNAFHVKFSILVSCGDKDARVNAEFSYRKNLLPK